MCQILSRSVYSVALWWRKKTQFLPYSGLRHSVVSPFGSNLTKLSTDAQLQTFPYPRHQNRFCSLTSSWRNRAQSSDVQKRDEQTDKQTKTQRFWLPRRRVKSEPHQTRHGDRGPRASSDTCKTFGVRRIVSPLGDAENLGVTRPCQLKLNPHNSITLGQIQRNFNS